MSSEEKAGRVPAYLAFVLKNSFQLLYLFWRVGLRIIFLFYGNIWKEAIFKKLSFVSSRVAKQHTNQKFHPHCRENTTQSDWYWTGMLFLVFF